MDSDSGITKSNPRPRRQQPPIKVWVNEFERQALSHRAAQTGLSLSAYLKVAGLNQPTRTQANLMAVTDLVRVNADLDSLAKLLQRDLERPISLAAPMRPKEVEHLVQALRQSQDELRVIMAQLVK